MFRRGKTYYVENASTGKQESLRTSDAVEAQRILGAKNEAANNSKVTLAVGKAYLAVTDPEMLTRTPSRSNSAHNPAIQNNSSCACNIINGVEPVNLSAHIFQMTLEEKIAFVAMPSRRR